MLLLFDLKKVVVIAALLSVILCDHVHSFDGAS